MTGRRLRALLRKEFIQLLRDPVLVLIALYVFVESSMCAAALQLEVQNVPLAVYDRDRSPESRQLAEMFAASPNFRITENVASDREVAHELESGAARVVLSIPSDFSRAIAAGRTPAVAITSDGTDAYSSLLANGYAENIISQFAQQRLYDRFGALAARDQAIPGIPVIISVWYDPALKYPHFNIVMMLALAVPIVGILLSAASLARESDAGTLERISITPVRPWEFILAKLAPTATVTLGGVSLGIVLAIWGTGAPFRGNLLFFYTAALLAFMASAGIGVLIATATRNVQQALLAAFFILFPLLFLSGTITPLDNMPKIMQYLTFASPLRYFGAIAINIFFKGGGPAELWPQTLALAALSSSLFSLAFWRLRRGLQT